MFLEACSPDERAGNPDSAIDKGQSRAFFGGGDTPAVQPRTLDMTCGIDERIVDGIAAHRAKTRADSSTDRSEDAADRSTYRLQNDCGHESDFPFGKDENSILVSYLRLSIGASDLDSEVFSYDDLPSGQIDVELSKFSLTRDKNLMAMLKEILTINPDIKIIAAPWSPPVWMKDNGKTKGGSLKPEFYRAYANYFVKYIQEMKKGGIKIDAITPQNEPLHPGNNPSLYMPSAQQGDFIKNHLGPVFKTNGIATKIVIYDHNCNKPEYAIDMLKDPEAYQYIDGSAFHLYEGEISALTTVHNAFPDKNLYFTEQWTGSKGNFNDDLNWHTKNVIIGSMRNWSKTALEWNLANDPQYGPHTEGGCTECKGAITVSDSENFTRNVAYYIIAHASKFVPPGSRRIASSQTKNLSTAAFMTQSGKIVIIVQNEAEDDEHFNIKFAGKSAAVTISGKSTATYIF